MPRLAYYLLWLYVFTIPWENIITLPGLGTLSRLVGITAVGVGFLHVLLVGRVQLHRVHIPAIAFVLLALASFLWTISPSDTQDRNFQYILLLLFMLLMFNVVESPAQIRGLLIAYVLGCLIGVANTFQNFLSGSEVAYERYAADGFDPNDLAFVLALGIPLAWYLALTKERSRLVWLYRLYPVLALIVNFLAAARAGLLGVAAGLLFVFVTLPRASTRLKVMVTVLGLAALWLIPVLVPPENFSRLATIAEELRSGTLNDRTNIWQAGFQTFNDHLWLGTGAGTFGTSMEDQPMFRQWMAPHNLFVSLSTELGLVGVGLFILLLLGVVWSILELPSLERLLWLTVFVILMLVFNSQNWEWRKQTWLMLGLILTHWKVLHTYLEAPWKPSGRALSS
ncbi:MAG: O-antigen ligase family protein [Thermaceae bacterium]|nr:O-antigen ligase family protein [Thermaceae bacterium]